jgi:hypothetical protein
VIGTGPASAGAGRGQGAKAHDANLTEWIPDDAWIFTIYVMQGMAKAADDAAEQQVEMPNRVGLGRFADHLCKVNEVFVISADTMRYDFGWQALLEFAFIDGGHDLEHALHDRRVVWHDFESPVP